MNHLDYSQQSTWHEAGETPLQSPINIESKQLVDEGTDHLNMLFTGKTQYEDRVVGEQFLVSGTLQVDGQTWQLERIHFHEGAEHLIDGYRHDAETHFVYLNGDKVLVVAAFADVSKTATTHTIIQDIYHTSIAATRLIELLPQDHSYYRYTGSLTTPPLGQDVTWLVLKQPIVISSAELALLHEKYPNNYRDVQHIAARDVKVVADR